MGPSAVRIRPLKLPRFVSDDIGSTFSIDWTTILTSRLGAKSFRVPKRRRGSRKRKTFFSWKCRLLGGASLGSRIRTGSILGGAAQVAGSAVKLEAFLAQWLASPRLFSFLTRREQIALFSQNLT
jgi:hypothetical protein